MKDLQQYLTLACILFGKLCLLVQSDFKGSYRNFIIIWPTQFMQILMCEIQWDILHQTRHVKWFVFWCFWCILVIEFLLTVNLTCPESSHHMSSLARIWKTAFHFISGAPYISLISGTAGSKYRQMRNTKGKSQTRFFHKSSNSSSCLFLYWLKLLGYNFIKTELHYCQSWIWMKDDNCLSYKGCAFKSSLKCLQIKLSETDLWMSSYMNKLAWISSGSSPL